MAGHQKTFTTGSINRAIVLLSVPMMLEMAMESLFLCVNLLFVSKLGEKAITIVGITNSITLIIHSITVGLSIAATAVITRRVGEKKPKSAGIAAVQALLLGLGISLLFGLVFLFFTPDVLKIAGASEELRNYGGTFSCVMLSTVVFMILRILMNGILRGAGDAATALRALVLSNSVNVFLCCLLIFGLGPIPAFGLMGVAIATVVANMTGVAYQLLQFKKGNGRRIVIGRNELLVVPAVLGKILKLAASGTVQYLVPSSSRFLMIVIVVKLGENVLAGYILSNRIIMFTALPAWGIANAAGVLTGQNLGAKQPDRAEQSVWKTGAFNLCFLGSIAMVLLIWSNTIVAFFSTEPTVVHNASQYLQFMSIAYFFFGYTMVISRSLNAAGSVQTVTWLHVLMFYVTQLPLAYFLAIFLDWGATGIFAAIAFSEIVLALACFFVFKTGKWKSIQL